MSERYTHLWSADLKAAVDREIVIGVALPVLTSQGLK